MKESFDAFRLIVESMEDVILLQDSGGLIVYASPSAQRLTGFTPKELAGTLGDDLIHPDDRSDVEQYTSADGATDPIREMEFRCRTCDGLYRWVAARSQFLRGADGQPFRLLRRIRDISTRKEQEEESRRLRQREAVSRLAGGVAHDFNNLLTVITGYTSVLLDTHGPDDPDHEALTQIQRAAERTAGLVRQLLAISGRQMLHLARVDLNDVLRHRIEVFKRLLGPDIHLNLNLEPSLQPVKVDVEQLEQVLLELASRARGVMPSGGQLTLTTANVSADTSDQLAPDIPSGPAVRLTVCDTGRGMDERGLSRLFEPFFTIDGAVQGSGLGMAAVQGTIRQCGGHIAAAGRPGAGTTFTLTFPAVPAAPTEAQTILLVDDESGVRALAAHILRAQGYQVLEASQGQEALEVHARHAGAIHLLISDVVMPVLGGPELAQRLAERDPDLPILFMSGCNKDDADLSGIGERPPRFLAKPFLPAALVHAAREALDERRT